MKRATCSLLLLLTLGLVPGVDAARTVKHSGMVVAIDPQEAVMVLDEVGPWRLEQGETVVTRRTITLTSSTTFASYIRVTVPGRFAGDFLEVPLRAEEVVPGDFATAECLEERGRLVAVHVAVARPD